MAKGFFVKTLRSLAPADDDAEAIVRSIGMGETVSVEVKRPRNLKHHLLFFALMNLVWQNSSHDKYATVDDLVTEVKLVTGHYDRRIIQFEGKPYNVLTPRSISFAAMDQVAFDAFFQRVCDWVSSDVLPGVTEAELRQELETMTGARG